MSDPHIAPITIRVTSWQALTSVMGALQGYIFRGHPDAAWQLVSTLERELSPQTESIGREAAENKLLKEFQRRAHHYVTSPPRAGFTMEWMALLRHYGGPSRLLDMTRSPYVAAFFALDSASPARSACIWAIHERAVSTKVTEKLKERHHDLSSQLLYIDGAEHTAAELMEEQHLLIACIEPDRLNERISIQQGVFLLPLSLESRLYELLLATLDIKLGTFDPLTIDQGESLTPDPRVRGSGLVKIEFPGAIRKTALKELHLMNVSASTLYPGLEGFAKSLRTRLSIEEF